MILRQAQYHAERGRSMTSQVQFIPKSNFGVFLKSVIFHPFFIS